MDHGALVTHGHARTHRECTGQELDDQRLEFENIFDFRAIEKAYDFWDPAAGGRGLVQDERAGGHHEDDGVADGKCEGSGKVSFLQKQWVDVVFYMKVCCCCCCCCT